MIVTQGILQLKRFIIGGANENWTAPTHIGVGTGTTSPVTTDTALETEVYPDTSARNDTTITTGLGVVSFDITIASDEANSNTLAEVGLFTASTDGTMWGRMTHPDLPKTSDDVVPTIITLVIESIKP